MIRTNASARNAGRAAEAETERGNDDAGAALVVHKRHGKGQAADQWVTLTLAELVALLNGNRDHMPIRPENPYRSERGESA